MRHRIGGRQLNRTRNQRQALFRSLLRSFFTHGHIITTAAKAKSIVTPAEKIALLAVKGDLTSVRTINQTFDSRTFVASLVKKMQLTFADQKCNFTKIEKYGYRQGDNALTVKLSLVKPFVLPEIKTEDKKVKVAKIKKVEVKKTVNKKKESK